MGKKYKGAASVSHIEPKVLKNTLLLDYYTVKSPSKPDRHTSPWPLKTADGMEEMEAISSALTKDDLKSLERAF